MCFEHSLQVEMGRRNTVQRTQKLMCNLGDVENTLHFIPLYNTFSISIHLENSSSSIIRYRDYLCSRHGPNRLVNTC
jgi:hypothetical protein